jgi:hypothetical protein
VRDFGHVLLIVTSRHDKDTVHFTLWPSLRATSGCHAEITWESFLSFVASPTISADKTALEGWSPIRAKDNRRGAAFVELISAVVLDDDSSGLSTDAVCEVYAGVAGVVHTSFSHTPEHPKHRIVLRTTRDMTPDEYARVWRYVRDKAERLRQRLDEAPKDASRFWYVPGHPAGAAYTWRAFDGSALDVDGILATAPDLTNERGSEPIRTELLPVVGGVGRRAPVAAMLGAAWPAKGRHEAQLALAGALRGEGWPEVEALEFLCAVCRAAGNEDRPKREATIRHTYAQPEGAPLTGWTRLKSFIDSVVVDAARGALGRDAEWTEATSRKLAEAAVISAKPIRATSPDTAVTIQAGPFAFKVGGLDAPLPPLQWLVHELICRGDVTMLVAHGNSLKTWLAFSLLLAVSTGKLWLGRFAVTRGRAALIDFESGDYEVARRLQILGAKDVEVGDRLLRSSFSGANLVDPAAWIALAKLGLELLVIDSFNAASPEQDENDARAALMLQHAGRFANATGCTVIVIHHARKGSGGDSREVVRGTSALYAACDRVFKFDEPEKPEDDASRSTGVVRSTMRSLKDGAGRSPAPVSVELSDAGLRWLEPEAAPKEEDKPEKNRELVLSILKQNSAGVAKEHLVNLMSGKREKKFELLSQLVLSDLAVEYRNGAEKKVFLMLKPGSTP